MTKKSDLVELVREITRELKKLKGPKIKYRLIASEGKIRNYPGAPKFEVLSDSVPRIGETITLSYKENEFNEHMTNYLVKDVRRICSFSNKYFLGGGIETEYWVYVGSFDKKEMS